MRRHINLRQIEAFKAVIESGTVSRAAELMNVSQPAISKLIAHLETDTGLRLFDRLKGRLAPSEQAMQLYNEVGRIFAGVRQVESAVDAIRREEQGRLAIGVMPALSGAFIQRAISRFHKVHGNVFCTVQSMASLWAADWLIARKLDIGLVDSSINNPYVILEPLAKHPLVCIMPCDHPLTAKKIIEPRDLNGVRLVAFHSDLDVGHQVEKMFEASKVTAEIALRANIAPTVCEFVVAGYGVSLVPPLFASGLEDRLAIRPFRPELHSNFQICRSPDSRNAHLVEAFAQVVRDTATEISRSMLTEIEDSCRERPVSSSQRSTTRGNKAPPRLGVVRGQRMKRRK